jgi:hypothetical protein
MQPSLGALWISPATAILVMRFMFYIFPLLGLSYLAITTLARMFVIVEAFERLMSSPAARANTQLSFWITLGIYLSSSVLERYLQIGASNSSTNLVCGCDRRRP